MALILHQTLYIPYNNLFAVDAYSNEHVIHQISALRSFGVPPWRCERRTSVRREYNIAIVNTHIAVHYNPGKEVTVINHLFLV